jgi:ribosomal protein S18 acetylase RimI-like enzyme
VHVASWQHAYTGVLPGAFLRSLDRGQRERWWRRFIEQGARVHVIGEDRVQGFCHAGPSEDDGWGEVFSIYVHPAHWGEGLGRTLLDAGAATLRDEGFDRGLLWVLEANTRARRFYERQGWRVGKPIRVEDIGGNQVTEVRYEIDLTDPL